MRKQLAIGVSVLALTALGGVSENNVSTNLQGASPQYTHFVRTSLNQTFESLSGASLNEGLPYRTNYQTAGVHFIVSNQGADFGNDDAKNNDFSDPAGETCKNLGYTVTSCETGLFNKACPYNDALYDRCCDVAYKYTSSTCSSPKKLSSDICGGKYRCYCDTSTYPYASCNSPQIKGNSCTDDTGTRYATCTCPSGVATPYGCETYYASPCNSVCQKAYADNCRNRTSVQTPYGCETYFSDCKSKCQKAYADNCRNQTAVITSCPTNANCTYFADCKSKVQSWSCKSGFVKSGNTCVNPCDNRTAVISSCPSNATCSYFSDCSSKIQSWSCNSGYEKSGNSCVQAIKSRTCQYVGDVLYSDRTCADDINKLDTNKSPIGVVFDEINRLAIALEQAKLQWSTDFVDLPSLGNCTEVLSCSTNGKYDTSAIITYSNSSGKYPAAEYCINYKPASVNKDEAWFAKGQWFLPSVKELQTLYINKNVVNASLQKINALTLSLGYYWSSTEALNVSAWHVSMNTGPVGYNLKSGSYYVRPVIKY